MTDDRAHDGVRTKTVHWNDPMATAELSRSLSGRDFLTKWMHGDLPGAPICELMGFRLAEVAEGEVAFTCTPDESVYNPIGMVHGGLACTVLDSAAGCAVHSTLPAGFGYSSIEIKVSFLRPIQAYDGDIVARGWVTKPGKRVSFAEADLRDAHGMVLATASSSCLIVPV
ncbi:PaaI family thioesterase [Gordonia sp. X0973]|uniref:PaaI family thioesterase n=1 Tax=Gordonia sp. X0973 TaxID=2742602 RepID=UPI000F5478A8|nr:PaaI family thioesterase [Gordonia sp. X0973]QKT07844.1 PaaI family thioesterase [Gordonia sp. X0973]